MKLRRYGKNPIVAPNEANAWEARARRIPADPAVASH